MTLLTFGSVRFDADLVVFDKDGTLTDFEAMWGRLAVAWVVRLTAHAGDAALRRELYHALGYDPQRQRTRPQSPLVIASEEQLLTIAAAVLYRRGVSWPEAERRVRLAYQQAVADLPLGERVRAAGDVAALLQRLRDVGVRVAVVTIDVRQATGEILRILGIADRVDHLVCGDDGLPWKPAPDMLLAACKRLKVEPARTAVVGDTVADLEMARRAGAGLAVAVLSGTDHPSLLAAQADVVLCSIDEIKT